MSRASHNGRVSSTEPPRRGRPGPDPALVAQAAQLRAQGLSDRQIAAELGAGSNSVGRWLRDQPPGPPPAPADRDAVARLRDTPAERTRSWREIGAELGVSAETARQRYLAQQDR